MRARVDWYKFLAELYRAIIIDWFTNEFTIIYFFNYLNELMN